ncbi:MAG TPA: twin-arginine translocase subunit TatC [Chondromyces sp.]|nr:twin-arginine translocase subunit TatC [Chondromyces sp.]
MEQQEIAQEEQTVVEHIIELRKALLYSLLFFAVCFVIMLVFMHKIIPILAHDHKLVMLGPLEVVKLYAGIAMVLSLGISAPFIGYQLWVFAKPALTERESKMAFAFLPAILLSFLLGIAFGFFIIFPTVYHFLLGLGSQNFEMMVTAKEYFYFLIMTTMPIGFLFEVPLLLMFLTAIQLVTPDQLSKARKYAYLVLAVVSAVITPPDFISQIIVMIPLMALYEFGIILSKITYKMKHRSSLETDATT